MREVSSNQFQVAFLIQLKEVYFDGAIATFQHRPEERGRAKDTTHMGERSRSSFTSHGRR